MTWVLPFCHAFWRQLLQEMSDKVPCLNNQTGNSFLGKYITAQVYGDFSLCNEVRQYYVVKAAIHKHYSIMLLQGLL